MSRNWPSLAWALTSIAAVLIVIGVPLAIWPVHATETTRVTMTMLNAASTIQATGTLAGASIMPACRESVIYVQWSAGTSAGVVTVESADSSAYAGTWAPLATVTWSAASKEDIVQITGIHLNLRTRVSTGVVGGTVTTIMGCN
jgi:hypothetical protein